MNSILSKAPISRILVPYIIGILIPTTSYAIATIILSSAIIVAICFWVYSKDNPKRTLSLKPFRILPIALISISLGIFNSHRVLPSTIHLRDVNNKLIGCTIHDIQSTERSMTIVAQNPSIGKVQLTTRGCNYNLYEGCKIAFRANLQEIKSTNNPHEFKYSEYLRNNGIIYTQHLQSSGIHIIGEDDGIIFKIKRAKYNIEKAILSTNIPSDIKYFVIAIALGNNKYIGTDTQNLFSHAGIAHILALSGLHIGIITMLLWFLLFPLDLYHLKKLRLIVTLTLIAFYAIFTGLSPSVVRSTIMVGFAFASFVFFRKNTTLNSLFVAALIILVASPNAIYSLSFQLSFITVLFIIAFSSALNQLAQTKIKILNYLISSLGISLIATAATASITAFYFNSMPIFSFITNLLVVPVLPAVMIVAIAFTIYSCVFGEASILSYAIELCYNYISGAAKLISSLPGAYIDNIFITLSATICITLAVLAIGIFYHYRNRYVAYTIGCLASLAVAFQLHHIITIPNEGFIIFNSFNSTPIMYYNGHKASVWCPDQQIDLEEFKQTHKGFLAFNRIENVDLITSETTVNNGAKFLPPYASLAGQNIAVLGHGKWKHISVDKKIKVVLAIITKRYHADINTLTKIFDAKTIIISGDVYDNSLQRLKEQLKKANINYYSIPETGAFEYHK